MPDELEAPTSASQLYAGRGDEIPVVRPAMQGDVYREIEIPGVDDGVGLAAILTHPCSMRADGIRLKSHQLMGRVQPCDPIPFNAWRSHHFGVLPLAELEDSPGSDHKVVFDLCGRVSSHELVAERRVACLDAFGVSLLQQRFVNHLTRYVVPTADLHAVFVHVLEEAELLEGWLLAAEAADADLEEAGTAFHELIRIERPGGGSLQADLKDQAKRAAVRRAVGSERVNRFGS